MKYAWIARNKTVWPFTLTCEVLEVSTSGYFEHQRRLAEAARRGHKGWLSKSLSGFNAMRGIVLLTQNGF